MTGIGTQIKNALGWFLTRLKGNVVNNLTSTSTDLPLSAAKGKDLQDQITSLNTNMICTFFDKTGDGKNYFYISKKAGYTPASIISESGENIPVTGISADNNSSVYTVRLLNNTINGTVYRFYIIWTRLGAGC